MFEVVYECFIGSLLSAGASLIGGLMQNKSAEDNANKQMDFQERMSSTAYRRATEDMKAAGLNPILAATKGGASAPAGTAAPVVNVLEPAVASARQSHRVSAEVENMLAQNQNLHATNANLREQEKNLAAERVRIGAGTANIAADTLLKTKSLEILGREAHKAQTDEEFYKSPAGEVTRTIGTILREINPFGDSGIRVGPGK